MTNVEIAQLEEVIRYHQRLYYDMSAPEITDQEFDKLWEALQAAAPDSPVLSERSQYDADFKHEFPMGSLSKLKTLAEVYEKFKGQRVTITAKIDGASVALHYQNGRLLRGVSRGRTETQKGKLITPNVAVMRNLPLDVTADTDLSPAVCEVRGEAVILRKDFYGIMDQPGYEGMEKGLANPRNAASGGLTCQDPNATWRRKLHFVACKTVFRNADVAFVDSQPLVLLKKLGFTVPAYVSIEIDSIETLQSAVQEFAEQRSELPYDTDGIVIRLADESAYNAAGMTGVCPNGAVAFKFETEQAETTIRMITCETGRLGYVTPVAIFDAVQLGGANVTRCCLHNWDWMRKHGNPSLGARVIIEKCGDIIPGLASVIKAGAGEVSEPSVCSSCGGKLTYESTADGSEGKKLKCTNREHCPVQFRDTILNMLRVLEVKGIAEKALDAMISAGILKSPCDLFAMKPADLRSAGFGPGESVNIFEALSDIKADAATVLAALGIESWGKRMFQKLQSGSTFYSDSVMVSGDFKMCDLIQVPGVGPGRARILSDAFVAGERGYGRKLLYALLGHVVVDVKQKVAGALSGKSFCLSGTLPQGKKKIEADIVAQGGDVKSDVAKGLSFLVAGEGSGSKSEKARKYGIPVISAEQLYSMMQGKQV